VSEELRGAIGAAIVWLIVTAMMVAYWAKGRR
jgi:hypothetical protein